MSTETLTPLPSTIPPGSIVDSYRRDSGGMRQDKSTAQQLTDIQSFCKKHNLILRHNFVDEARSDGSTAGRDEFDRMIAATRNEDDRPTAILLWNYARFARDLDDSILQSPLAFQTRHHHPLPWERQVYTKEPPQKGVFLLFIANFRVKTGVI